MSSALSAAASGLQAASLRLDATAHNLANAHTPGFRRDEVKATARPGSDGVDARIERSAHEGVSLEQEVVDQMTAAVVFKANAKLVSTVDRTLGAWLDEKA